MVINYKPPSPSMATKLPVVCIPSSQRLSRLLQRLNDTKGWIRMVLLSLTLRSKEGNKKHEQKESELKSTNQLKHISDWYSSSLHTVFKRFPWTKVPIQRCFCSLKRTLQLSVLSLRSSVSIFHSLLYSAVWRLLHTVWNKNGLTPTSSAVPLVHGSVWTVSEVLRAPFLQIS